MTHIEVMDKVMKTHGTNYYKVSQEREKGRNYYYMQFNSRFKNPGIRVYADFLAYFGCRFYAVGAGKRVDLTDFMQSDEVQTTITATIKLLSVFGMSLVVADGADEYAVTSGELNEQTKVRGRKRGHAPRSDAVLHGPGEV